MHFASACVLQNTTILHYYALWGFVLSQIMLILLGIFGALTARSFEQTALMQHQGA